MKPQILTPHFKFFPNQRTFTMQVEVREDSPSNDNKIASLLIIGYLKEQFSESITSISTICSYESIIIQIIKIFFVNQAFIDTFNNEPTPTPQPMDIYKEITSSNTYNNNRKPSNNKSREQTTILIDGYIHEQSQILNISITSVISDIIQEFYQKMKGTTFIWNITNKKSKLLSKVLSSTQPGFISKSTFAPRQPCFDSDVFSIQTTLKNPSGDPLICGYCNNGSKIIGT